MVVSPEGAPALPAARTRADPAMVKALARAHRWKRMLEDGRYASISEIPAEKLDRGYVGQVLKLTLLAPHIVEAVLDGAAACGSWAADADESIAGGLVRTAPVSAEQRQATLLAPHG
jgi:hypothetical protein